MTSSSHTPNLKRITRIMKALANENRLALYLSIREAQMLTVDRAPCFVNEIAADLRIGPPTVSHHLKELERADLIITERIGKRVAARLNEGTANLVKGIL
ncbi:MAG: hypothetical protein RhofKO_30750 [Rhodothermales bacterium]